jgi:hypothetical protein
LHPDGSEEIKIRVIIKPELEEGLRALAIQEALSVAKAMLITSDPANT